MAEKFPTNGLHDKYRISRTDGSSRKGGKHHDCFYFVLDLSHDEAAWDALRAYRDAVVDSRPDLAADLTQQIDARAWRETSQFAPAPGAEVAQTIDPDNFICASCHGKTPMAEMAGTRHRDGWLLPHWCADCRSQAAAAWAAAPMIKTAAALPNFWLRLVEDPDGK